MNRWSLWITTFVLGAAALLIVVVFFLPAALLALVLAVALVVRGAHLVALSGLLTGFGALWTFLLVLQFASGSTLDNSTFWLSVGFVPLAVGLILLVFVAWRSRSAAHG